MNRKHRGTECERFVQDMLAHMTPLEKVGQLAFAGAPNPADPGAGESFARALRAGRIGGVRGVSSREQAETWQRMAQEETRLGIPLFFTSDVRSGLDTVFPTPATMCAGFDIETTERVGRVMAQEAEAHGINWAMGPKATAGTGGDNDSEVFCAEQVRLVADLVAAQVAGMQASDDAGNHPLLACLDLVDGAGAHDAQVITDTLEIARAAIATDVGSLALHHTAEQVRRQMEHAVSRLARPGGYDGVLLTEWDALANVATGSEAGSRYRSMPIDSLVEALGTGRIDANLIDDVVARVLRAKFRIGLFARELSGAAPYGRGPLPTPVHNREIALEAARRSLVLLRNDPAYLPLGIDSGDLLVVGSAAADRTQALAGRKGVAASLIDGLEQLGVPHRFVPGLALRNNGAGPDRMIDADRMAIGMASEAAKRAGTTIVVAISAADGSLGEAQHQLLTSLVGANPRIVLVTIGPRAVDPLVEDGRLPCVLHAGEAGSMAGHAIAELLSGEAYPSGKLPYSLVASDGNAGLAFGHGETYADFALTGVAIQLENDRIAISGELRNVGHHEGTETIQIYVTRPSPAGAEASRRNLVSFTRHHLRPSERKTLLFEIGREEIGIVNAEGRFEVEPGEYEVFLGVSSTRGIGQTIDISEKVAKAIVRARPVAGWRTAVGGRRSA